MFLKPYNERPFYGDAHNGLKFNFHAEIMKKIMSWDRCKFCNKGEKVGRGEWQDSRLIKTWLLVNRIAYQYFIFVK